MRCQGCGKIIWFWQLRTWGYGPNYDKPNGVDWIHSNWDGDGPCRRLSFDKYAGLHPEKIKNPLKSAFASRF